MSITMDRVEIFAVIQSRRRSIVEQKLAVLAEASKPGMTMSYVGRRHGIYMDAARLQGILRAAADKRGCGFISGL